MDDDSLLRVTASQREYLALVGLRLSSKQIGRLVGRTPAAIDTACKRAVRETGAPSRFVLADKLAMVDPAMTQLVTQRYGLTAKSLAELRLDPADEGADATADRSSIDGRADRQWWELLAWQRQLWMVAVAFGTLALTWVLVAFAHGLLAHFSAIFR